jgi:hypothetical protein
MKPSRRDLLRGTLAAPLVLTARTAGAWAQTSAGVCRTYDKDRAQSNPPKECVSVSSDEWLRIRVRICGLKDSKGNSLSGKYCKGCGSGTGWQYSTTYWKVDDSDPYNIKLSQTSWTTGNCAPSWTSQYVYCIAYCDDSGNVCGYGCQPNGGYPVSASCWTSLVPGGNTNLTV